ncbi:hypothetical protein M434DRAFT_392019 [Hypoxylon sp. CO27-5]|nr:hypothetical protein M434DRAFT_392019 [Hypoxylon sp. CO27-5]
MYSRKRLPPLLLLLLPLPARIFRDRCDQETHLIHCFAGIDIYRILFTFLGSAPHAYRKKKPPPVIFVHYTVRRYFALVTIAELTAQGEKAGWRQLRWVHTLT